jgi:lipopolysaccharide/colanic/teichoic acid biosynthesis glycosyltransferase
LIATLALILDLGAFFILAPGGAIVRCAIVAVPVLLWFSHLAPRRGRRASVLVAAGGAASALSFAALAVWNAWRPVAPAWAFIAPALILPWPGHLLALLRAMPALPPGPPLVHDRMARAFKRACDVAACAILGLPAVPVVALAAALVKLTSPGPAFYSQTRVTARGRIFRIWKLRTMTRDAESGTPVWPEENDPRITRLGRVLRLLWIDELPQFWNVLQGDMSVVGPRPERPEFVEAFAAELPKYRERHAVAAGITGLAQVTGLIGNTSIRRRLALDLHYVRVWTPGLDASIVARTAAQALQRALGRRSGGRPAPRSGLGGTILELRGVARHLPERDQ